MVHSRRYFLKQGAMAGSGLLLSKVSTFPISLGSTAKISGQFPLYGANELLNLSHELVEDWVDGILALQILDKVQKGLYGGILCPSCAIVHGRCGDAIFPLMYMYEKSGDQKYLEAALRLYGWMENMVSMPDGSWLNEVHISEWKGITVFTAITLAETLVHFGKLLDAQTKTLWEARLKKAGEFLAKTFTIDTGNINYPLTGSYALCLIGKYLRREDFIAKGKLLAGQGLSYFTPADHLIYGEGRPEKEISPKGCYSVDLGYNVEESLPALVMYARLTGDQAVLSAVEASLKAHMEFMLPDGGWDNSWGTRNFKWTYWGSRTSDGCQAGYALMAAADPRFYTVALRNTELLKRCTRQHLLHGGPHYASHGVTPCVHHTFGHSKALTSLLVRAEEFSGISTIPIQPLPRTREYGVKHFKDIATWLIAKYGWRATITAYDQEYLMRSGHASGGAVSMLWHQKTGAILSASMTVYQMEESANMQRDKDPFSTCLTPRLEIRQGKDLYSNIHDLKAGVNYRESGQDIIFQTCSFLVNAEQQAIKGSPVSCQVSYTFSRDGFTIDTRYGGAADEIRPVYVLPVISAGGEKVNRLSDRAIEIIKPSGKLHIRSDQPLRIGETTNGRIFNFVPGMEAIPLIFDQPKNHIVISVS